MELGKASKRVKSTDLTSSRAGVAKSIIVSPKISNNN